MTYVYQGCEMYKKAILEFNVASNDPDLRQMYLTKRTEDAGVNVSIFAPTMIQINLETSITPTKCYNYFSPPSFYVYCD